jgi:hypothetical protein
MALGGTALGGTAGNGFEGLEGVGAAGGELALSSGFRLLADGPAVG